MVALPAPQSLVGFGYSVFGSAPFDGTINLSSGQNPVGSLSFSGVPDPSNPGGFAGVFSTIPFDRVTVTFSPSILAYAVDNLRFATAAIPEPSSLVLMAIGTLGLGIADLLRRRTT